MYSAGNLAGFLTYHFSLSHFLFLAVVIRILTYALIQRKGAIQIDVKGKSMKVQQKHFSGESVQLPAMFQVPTPLRVKVILQGCRPFAKGVYSACNGDARGRPKITMGCPEA